MRAAAIVATSTGNWNGGPQRDRLIAAAHAALANRGVQMSASKVRRMVQMYEHQAQRYAHDFSDYIDTGHGVGGAAPRRRRRTRPSRELRRQDGRDRCPKRHAFRGATMSPGTCERDPDTEVPSVDSSPDQGTASIVDSTALPELSEWAERRNAVVAWLPHATREAVEAFALRHFDRAESAAFLIAEQIERDRRIAERMASIEVSQALNWTAQSRRPSHAELVRRRSVVA